MKRTAHTLSWILIASALTIAACGDRSESHKSSVKRGTDSGEALEKLDDSLADADTSLSGLWLDMNPKTEQGVTRTTFWTIDKDQKNIVISLICESDSNAVNSVAQGASRLQAKRNDLLLKNEINDMKPLKMLSGQQMDCQLNRKAGKIHYNLNGNVLEILSETNESLEKFCAASMDSTLKRPVAKEGCLAETASSVTESKMDKKDETKVDSTEVPELKDLSLLSEEDAKAALEAEGPMSKEIKNETTRWILQGTAKKDPVSKKLVNSFLTLSLGKLTADGPDIFLLQRRCYFVENTKIFSDAQINPEAQLTGKRIRILGTLLSDKVAAKGEAPACEVSISDTTKDNSYTLVNGDLVINQASVTEKSIKKLTFKALPNKKSAPTATDTKDTKIIPSGSVN